MRLSTPVETPATARHHVPGLPALETEPGAGAPPTAPSFVNLLNALASSQDARARDNRNDGGNGVDTVGREHSIRGDAPRPAAVAALHDVSRSAAADRQPMPSPQPSQSQPQLPQVSSSSPLPPAHQVRFASPADAIKPCTPMQAVPEASATPVALIASRMRLPVVDDASAGSGEALQPAPRSGASAVPLWRADLDMRSERYQRAAAQTSRETTGAREENLLDIMTRDTAAIRARLAADGTWHARFHSTDHGPISVHIAPGRDGVLAVTVRAAREALARLDEDQMSAVLRRPVRLSREPNDAPSI